MDTSQYIIDEKKLHPISMIYRAIVVLPQALLPLYFMMQGDVESIVMIIFFIVIGLLSFPSIIIHYYNFNYSITEKEIIINSGFISKKHRNIPLKRIQNINTQQSFLQKLLGLTKVSLETAGDASSEGVLEFVSKAEAATIQNTIKYFQDHTAPETNNENPESNIESEDEIIKEKEIIDEERVLFKLSLKQAFRFGVLRFRPLLLIAIAWMWSMATQFGEQTFVKNVKGELETNFQNIFDQANIFEIVLVSLVFVVFALLLSWILDILLTVNSFYKFTLKFHKNKLFTTQGLFVNKTGTIPLKKLQMVVLFTNFIRRRFNYYGMKLETAGFGAKKAAKPEIAVPFEKMATLQNLANDIYQFNFPTELKSVSRKTIRRAFIRYLIVTLPITGTAIGFAITETFWLALIPTIFIPLLYVLSVWRYKYRKYHIDDEYVIIKQGAMFENISIVPISKIQTLNMRATFFQRKLKLANINIDTAANSDYNDASIIDIDEITANEIYQELLDKFQYLRRQKVSV